MNVIWALEADPGPFEVSSNLFEMEWPPRSGKRAEFPEVDRAGWFSPEVAEVKLFLGQRVFVSRLTESLAEWLDQQQAAQTKAEDARGRPSR